MARRLRSSGRSATIAGCLAAALFSAVEPAQGQSGRAEENALEFRTDLPWSHLTLESSAKVTGVSPLRVPGPLTGDFWLVAAGRGVETQRGRVSIRLDEEGSRIVSHGGIPGRQRFFRGLLFPGYAQMRSGAGWRGSLMTAATLGALYAVVRTQDDVWDEEDEKNQAQRELDAVDDAALRPAALAALSEAREEENVARDIRNLALMATGTAWGVSFLDAMFFSPGFEVATADETSLGLTMKRRSRGSAMIRSAVFPGLGQAYNGQPVKAFFVATGALLAASLYFAEQADLKQAESEIAQAEGRRESFPAGPDRDLSVSDVAGFEVEADGASRDRKLALLLVAGYWGASLLDTALSFDEPWGSTDVGEGWRFGLDAESGGPALVASKRF